MAPKEKVVKNPHTLRKVCSALGLEYDSKHKYITNGELVCKESHAGKVYRTRYFDGCFYPFLVEVIDYEQAR